MCATTVTYDRRRRGRDGERATGCRETSAFNLTAVRRRLMEGRCRRTYVDYNASSNFLENYYALILGTIFLATRIAVKPAVRWLLCTTRSETYSSDISFTLMWQHARDNYFVSAGGTTSLNEAICKQTKLASLTELTSRSVISLDLTQLSLHIKPCGCR